MPEVVRFMESREMQRGEKEASMTAHPNLGRSGAFGIVLQLLEDHPAGMTSSELERIIREGGMLDITDVDGRAVYFRVKRALDSLLGLKYIEAMGRQGKEGMVYRLVPGAWERDVKEELKRAILDVKKRMGARIENRDADQLLAAFEGVLEESGEELGIPRKFLPGKHAKGIKKSRT